jgi:hypothetical protein
MKFKLLVIDDELDAIVDDLGRTRRQYYDFLKEAFELFYLSNLDEIKTVAQPGNVNAILLDFVLDRWGTDAVTILAALDNDLPVGLISKHWGPNFDRLRQALFTYDQIAHVFTWEELATPERCSVVSVWLSNAITRKERHAPILPGENDPIRILHISDLQFGADLPADFETETALLGEHIRRRWGSPSFIAITGDVAERGLPEEYSSASNWLATLASQLDEHWSNERVLLIPGNHDLCWPLAWSGRIDIEKRELGSSTTCPALSSYIIEPFRQFASQLGEEGTWSEGQQYWVSGRHRRAGIILFGLNTCELTDEWGKPTKRLVDRTLSRMFKEVRQYSSEYPEALAIGFIHHPLFADDPTEVIVNRGSFLKNLSEHQGDILILCGHVHSDHYELPEISGVRILQLTASTPTKKEAFRPPDSLRSFGLITLERRKHRVSALSLELCRFESHRIDTSKKLRFERRPDGRFESVQAT